MDNFFDSSYREVNQEIFETGRVRSEINAISNLLQLSFHDKILDHCCGEGRHLLEFHKRGYNIEGVDIRELKINNTSANVPYFHRIDVSDNLPGKYNKIYNIYTSFGYGDDDTQNKIIKNLAENITKNGKLLLDVVNRGFLEKKLPYTKNVGCYQIANCIDPSGKVTQSILNISTGENKEIIYQSYYEEELIKKFSEYGFTVQGLFGNIYQKAFNRDSKHITLLFTQK